ncbi:glucose-1-phosphate cytidylyltransferase [soil metagenome]
MKTVILAGGYGTRLSEYTDDIPKPMVPVGGHPMLWHIMKIYAHFHHTDFILALGYKAEYVKSFFLNYYTLHSDFSIDMATGEKSTIQRTILDWKIALIDTGLDTMTGGRLRRLAPLLKYETFMCTYGDGVSNIDIDKLLEFHRSHGKLVTMSVARPSARFGVVEIGEDNQVHAFREKPVDSEGWVNCGFFVMEPGFLKYLNDDAMPLEREPLEQCAKDGQLMAYHHHEFWKCMDMKKDVDDLDKLWNKGVAPWHFDETLKK